MRNSTAPPAPGASPGWTPNGVPFFWVPKEAFRVIDDGLERGVAATAKLLYVALCAIANQSDSPTFARPITKLASVASLERRTVERRLIDLENLGLLVVTRRKIEGTRANDLSEYSLPTLSRHLATVSRNLATARSVPAVVDYIDREQENRRTGESGRSSTLGRLQTADRIALENKLKAFQEKAKRLAGDLSDRVQRETRPEDVAKLKRYREEISKLERSLGYDLD